MSVLSKLALFAMMPAAFAMQDAAAGKKLYDARCAGCHGKQGEGGRGAKLTTLRRAADDDALFDIIRKGIPGTEMPPAPLTDAEIRQVARFVRGLQSEAVSRTPANSARG